MEFLDKQHKWHERQVMSIEELDESVFLNPPYYQWCHKDIVSKPFKIICKGKDYFVTRDMHGDDNYFDHHYYTDCGLRPYENGKWNPSNYIIKYQPKGSQPEWLDDWF